MTTRVQVNRIVLDGYAYGPRDRRVFEDALTSELARLIADGGVAGRSSVAVPAAVAPALDVSVGTEPRAVGLAVARSVHAGLPR